MSDDAFAGLAISDGELVSKQPREKCGRCGASRKFYCYDCLVPIGPAANHPSLRLPIPLDVVLHHNEGRSKSTGLHACVLSKDAHLVVYPDELKDFRPAPGSFLLFPADAGTPSTPLDELDLDTVKRLVVVDSTWAQAKQMIREPVIAALPRVSIATEKTRFWRFQTGKPDECLATIEAIHSFYRQWAVKQAKNANKHEKRDEQGHEEDGDNNNNNNNNNHDDLLFYFKIMYDIVQNSYRSSGKSFTKRQRPGYIKDDNQDKRQKTDNEPQE
jgi:DTW domain-containing protein YfiP